MATSNVNDKPVIISKIEFSELSEEIKNLIENAYIIYPYNKALFQGIVHSVHNEIKRDVITFEELKKLPSQRGEGSLGSSGK